MDIAFSDTRLRSLANDFKKCKTALGKQQAEIFHRRLGELRVAGTLEEVRNLPGNYHELKANRKGSWACNLNHPYRLIFTPQHQPIPKNSDGQFEWSKITAIVILEIVDYH